MANTILGKLNDCADKGLRGISTKIGPEWIPDISVGAFMGGVSSSLFFAAAELACKAIGHPLGADAGVLALTTGAIAGSGYLLYRDSGDQRDGTGGRTINGNTAFLLAAFCVDAGIICNQTLNLSLPGRVGAASATVLSTYCLKRFYEHC